MSLLHTLKDLKRHLKLLKVMFENCVMIVVCVIVLSGATAQCCSQYGQGIGRIVLDQLACTGTESTLFDCPHNGVGIHDCSHFEDVGITCPRKKNCHSIT